MSSALSSTTVTNSNKSGINKPVKDVNKKVHHVNKNTSNNEKTSNDNVTSEVNKHQPTAEQMRLANLMNEKTDFNELQSKIEKIIELTGSSKDEAVVALHDCDGNLSKAVDMIFEGDPVNESEWKSSNKKKKSKPAVTTSAENEENPVNLKALNGERSRGGTGSGQRGGRGAPRLQKGAKFVPRVNKKEDNMITNFTDDNQENINTNMGNERDGSQLNIKKKYDDNRRGRGRGSGPHKGTRGGDRGRGTRTFQNRGYRSNVNANTENDSFPNSIDTWTNSTAEPNKPTVNNDCTTMTVGNWSDIAANEDWSEEDWDSNLMETKVFTPSAKTLQEKDELSEINNTSNINSGSTNQNVSLVTSILHKRPDPVSQQPQQQQQPTPSQQQPQTQQPVINSIINNNLSRNANPPSSGATLLQQLQQATSQPSQVNHYAMNYSKQATESIKSLVGIPSSSYNASTTGNILTTTMDNQNSLGHVRSQTTLSQNEPSGVTKPNQQVASRLHQQQQHKRPTKIPESAVEMPTNDSISSLNVQFGALDFASDTFTLTNDTTSFHGNVNNTVKDKTISNNSITTTQPNLSNTLLQDNSYRSNTANIDTTMSKPSSTVTSTDLSNSVLGNQNETVLDRKTTPTYTQKPLDTQQNKSNNLYPTSATHIHQQPTTSSDISNYKTVSYSQPDVTNVYGSSYGSINAYVYPQTTNHVGYSNAGYSNYSSGTTSGVPQKSGTLKDVDTSGAQKHGYTDLQNVQGSSLGLVSNSTVTTNVLKNSVPASKGIPNVPPGCAPVLSTQYIMGQAGVPFYPFYDVQIPTPREHNFNYTTGNTDVKYSRSDDGSNVVSTQSQQISQQTHPGHIFSQFPPGYGFFYTPGVNMVPQNLYGAAPQLFPVSPAANSHAGSAGSAFPKGATAYGSHSYASTGYDSLNSVPQPDYVKQSYGSAGNQQVKTMTTGTSGDLNTNQLYGKSHAQLTKSYDKASYQTATPPPFPTGGMTSFGATPSQFIQMLPQTQPSMLHHSLQGDGSQTASSGVGVSRPISQSQKGSGPNSKYYNSWA